MKRKHNKLTEHYLIPAVLFLLNICLAHLACVLVAGEAYSVSTRIVVAIAFVLLGSSLLVKKQIHLAGSILFYTVVVFLGLINPL